MHHCSYYGGISLVLSGESDEIIDTSVPEGGPENSTYQSMKSSSLTVYSTSDICSAITECSIYHQQSEHHKLMDYALTRAKTNLWVFLREVTHHSAQLQTLKQRKLKGNHCKTAKSTETNILQSHHNLFHTAGWVNVPATSKHTVWFFPDLHGNSDEDNDLQLEHKEYKSDSRSREREQSCRRALVPVEEVIFTSVIKSCSDQYTF